MDPMEPFYESAKQRAEQILAVSELFTLACSLRQSSTSSHLVNVNGNLVLRPLENDEIIILSSKAHCGCTSESNDWSRVLLMLFKDEAKSCADLLKEQVNRSHFAGTVVVLGLSSTMSNEECFGWTHRSSVFSILPLGIQNNGIISDCIFMPGSKVIGNSLVSRTFVDSRSILLNCGTISSDLSPPEKDSFQSHKNGTLTLSLGPEAGGSREVIVCAESTIIDVSTHLNLSPKFHARSKLFDISSTTASVNIISNNAYACNVPNLQDVYLSSRSYIDSASSVVQAILLPESFISNGSLVEKVLLQWKAQISNGAHVHNSILMECAAAETASIVNSSVIGPDSHVGGGETQHTLLGPNTNAHHQSLMIGVIWPLGRGNIGESIYK